MSKKSAKKTKPVAKKAKVTAKPAKATKKKPIAKAKTVKPARLVKSAAKPVAKKPVAKPVAVKPMTKPAAVTPVPAQKAAVVKPLIAFTVGHYVVYPTHGVGRIIGEETQEIGETKLTMFVIAFEKEKMTLRVPVGRAKAAGLRHISSEEQIKKAILTLKGKAKISRGMWSRRAQEYEAKINSGNLLAIAEVVRDLHRNVDQSERSYSERMIYESALGRLAGELAVAEAIDAKEASDKLIDMMRKHAKKTAAEKEAKLAEAA